MSTQYTIHLSMLTIYSQSAAIRSIISPTVQIHTYSVMYMRKYTEEDFYFFYIQNMKNIKRRCMTLSHITQILESLRPQLN